MTEEKRKCTVSLVLGSGGARGLAHIGIIDITKLQSKSVARDTYDMSLFEVIAKSMETMQSRIARLQLAVYSPDVIINIPVNACAFYEFYRANEMIEFGWQKAEEQLISYCGFEV